MTILSRRTVLGLPIGLAPGLGFSTPGRRRMRPRTLPGTIRFDLAGESRPPRRITLYIPPGEPPAGGWPSLTLLDGNALAGTASTSSGCASGLSGWQRFVRLPLRHCRDRIPNGGGLRQCGPLVGLHPAPPAGTTPSYKRAAQSCAPAELPPSSIS